MIGYLKILLRRWIRNPIALHVLVGAAGAPVAFAAAAYWMNYSSRPSTSHPALLEMHKTVFVSAVLFTSLAAGFAVVHLMTRTIHVEKQEGRIGLLRTSGFNLPPAVLCFLTAAAFASTLLAPLAMLGPWVLATFTDIPQIRPSLVIATVAMVNLLGPFVVASRLILPQAFALTASYSVAFVIAVYHTARVVEYSFSPPSTHIVFLVLTWMLASALLLMVAIRDSRGGNRLWV